MIRRGLICLLFPTFVWGQTAKPATPAPHKPAAPVGAPPATAAPDARTAEPRKTAPDAPVITIQGLCDNPPADKTAASDCKTVATRAEFEALGDPVAPTVAPSPRRQLATRTPTQLVTVRE